MWPIGYAADDAAQEHRRDKGPLDGTSVLGHPALPRDRNVANGPFCRSAPRHSNPDGSLVDRKGFLAQTARPGSGRYTDVWACQHGRWLAVSAHVTRC
jgi:hypothetical protein